ncbi:MAG: hypothetical protein WC444_04815 [Candidatus Paceibacterota bacterium]
MEHTCKWWRITPESDNLTTYMYPARFYVADSNGKLKEIVSPGYCTRKGSPLCFEKGA